MPALSALAFLLLVAGPAHADLFRWVDPETGSVKFSSVPPTDPSVNAEVLPYRGPVPGPKPPAAAPGATAAPVVAGASAGQPAVSMLETRLRELFTQLSGAAPQDFNRSDAALKQQLETYEAVRAELDRLDPAGAARRQRDATRLFERLKQGFAAGFSPTPPGQK